MWCGMSDINMYTYYGMVYGGCISYIGIVYIEKL